MATLLKSVRILHWVKNLLVLLPVLEAHRFQDLPRAALACLCFCLSASGVYVINDVLDRESDRLHRAKRLRPIASGEYTIEFGLTLAVLLLALSWVLACLVSFAFLGTLWTYFALACAYSLYVRRIAFADVCLLVGLNLMRIVAGAVAVNVPISFWAIAAVAPALFSAGMLKRFTELQGLEESHASRGYRLSDKNLVRALGIAGACFAAAVLVVWTGSSEASALFRFPAWLRPVCAAQAAWFAWAWRRASLGRADEDPVYFAVHDRVSQGLLAAILLLVGLAL